VRVGILRHRNQNVLGAALTDTAVDLADCGPWESITELIIDWQSAQPILSDALDQRASVIPGPVQWLAPIPNPLKCFLLARNRLSLYSGVSPLKLMA
jgi:hypothetical protein